MPHHTHNYEYVHTHTHTHTDTSHTNTVSPSVSNSHMSVFTGHVYSSWNSEAKQPKRSLSGLISTIFHTAVIMKP